MNQERVSPQEWNRRRDENTEKLRGAVEELTRLYEAAQRGERNHQILRQHIQAVQQLFNTLKPTHREEHQQLWSCFDSIRGQVRQEQEAHKQAQEQNARTLRVAIERLEANHNISGLTELYRDLHVVADDVDFPKIFEEIDQVQQLFKTLRPLRKEEHDELWERFNRFRGAVQHARQKRRERQDELLNENKRTIENALRDLEVSHELTFFDDLFSTNRHLQGFWSASKQVADQIRDIRLRKEDRQQLRDELNRLRDKATAIRAQVDQAWRERHQSNIAYKRSLIEKNESHIRHLESCIEANREKRDNARSRDFADVVQGWIDNDEEKICQVENRNRELEQEIADIERKL